MYSRSLTNSESPVDPSGRENKLLTPPWRVFRPNLSVGPIQRHAVGVDITAIEDGMLDSKDEVYLVDRLVGHGPSNCGVVS